MSADQADVSLLSKDEHARLSEMTDARIKAFVAGRALLRSALGEMLSCAPQDVPIVVSPNGRPSLGCDGPSFSISHTVHHGITWAAVVIADKGPLGIDIEHPDRKVDWRRTGARRLSEPEWQRLEQLGEADGRYEFFRLWTLKEALVKYHDGQLLDILKNAIIDWQGQQPYLPGGGPSLASFRHEQSGLLIGLTGESIGHAQLIP